MSLIQAKYGDVAAWLPERFASFDSETTGAQPETARIVTAHVLELGPEGSAELGAWLVNPGIEIPAEATAIHGITTERAREEGMETLDALKLITRTLSKAWSDGLPVVICNAPYDLTLLLCESKRLGLPVPQLGPVLDPLVIDRACEPYRKGSRKLNALAERYGVKLGTEHDSKGDALTAARVVWAQARKFTRISQMNLVEFQTWQAEAHRRWAVQFQEYLRKQGKPDVIDTAWPVRTETA